MALQSAPSSAWTEPPWSGWIETTGDALLILEAARRGLIPRVTRRLVDSERKMITSGSVFVFDEDESGIRRWTDGFFWSPSRILGNFLLYRETDKRGAGHRGARSDPEVNEHVQYSVDGVKVEGHSLSRPKAEGPHLAGADKHRERTLVGSLTNSYKFKSDGLMKKTFSLSIDGVAQHLISYYKIEDVENGRLRSPSSLPELASLDISPEYLDKTHFRNPPKLEYDIDGRPRYRGEADDIDMSLSLPSGPLSTASPVSADGQLSEGFGKRNKRFDPYNSSGLTTKRPRKNTKTGTMDASPSSDSHSSPQNASPSTLSPTTPGYPDGSTPSTPTYPPAYHAPGFHPGYPMPIQSHPHLYAAQRMFGQPGPQHHLAPPIAAPAQISYAPYPLALPTSPPAPEMAHGIPSLPQQPHFYYHIPPHPGYAPYPPGLWPQYTGFPPAAQLPIPMPVHPKPEPEKGRTKDANGSVDKIEGG